MKTFSWVVIGLVLMLGAGCASSSSAPAAAGPPADVTGLWSGGFYGPLSNSVSMQLKQQGAAVNGTIEVGGRADLSGPDDGQGQRQHAGIQPGQWRSGHHAGAGEHDLGHRVGRPVQGYKEVSVGPGPART